MLRQSWLDQDWRQAGVGSVVGELSERRICCRDLELRQSDDGGGWGGGDCGGLNDGGDGDDGRGGDDGGAENYDFWGYTTVILNSDNPMTIWS